MNNHYQLYAEAVLTLAETIVIKLDDAAQALNQQVANAHGIGAVDDFDKSSWKYYQNISGQYHFSDQMIQVVSLDTAEVIDFTTANLQEHLATRAAYAFGTRHYKELVQNHPGQELLILGILNPTPIQTAIDAKDGQILRYPSELVESNELNLIPKLQRWVYQYLDRWVNRAYRITDDLYAASYIGQLFLHLVQAIFAFRLEACKTPEAHSYHVREYLASHGGLDVYLGKLTLKQALWLYRNILYIQRHAGKRDTFDWLVENVMTERRLPLYEYTMAHNVSDMGRDTLTDDAHLLPAIEFKRKGINSYATSTDIDTYSLDRVLTKVEPLAPGNYRYHQDHSEEMRNQFAYSQSASSMTKMLESAVIDYSDAVVYTMKEILLNHWLGMVGLNKYFANVTVQLRNGDAIQLNAQDAVALYIYAVHKTCESAPNVPNWSPLVYVPKYQVNRLLRSTLPPIEELLSITERKSLPLEDVEEIYATGLELKPIISIEGFYNYCLEIYEAAQAQHRMYAAREDFLTRGDVQLAVSRFYRDEVVTLNTLQDPDHPGRGIPYAMLFQELGLELQDYSATDFLNLAEEIIGVATGVKDRPTNSLGELQRAMVSLFTKLSSYSIQVVSEINTSNIVVVENPAVRVSSAHAHQDESFHHYVPGAIDGVIDVKAAEEQIHVMPIAKIAKPDSGVFHHYWKEKMDITSTVRVKTPFHPIEPFHVRTQVDIRSSFDFEREAANLTTEQRTDLVDMYTDYMDSVMQQWTRQLRGFSYASVERELTTARFVTAVRELPEDTFNFRRNEKSISGFLFQSAYRSLPIARFVGGTKQLDIFTEDPIENTYKELPGFIAVVDRHKELPDFKFATASKQLNLVTGLPRSGKDLPATTMVGRNKDQPGYAMTGKNKDLPAVRHQYGTKELAGFTHSGGTFDSTDVAGRKEVDGFTPAS